MRLFISPSVIFARGEPVGSDGHREAKIAVPTAGRGAPEIFMQQHKLSHQRARTWRLEITRYRKRLLLRFCWQWRIVWVPSLFGNAINIRGVVLLRGLKECACNYSALLLRLALHLLLKASTQRGSPTSNTAIA
mmetsp:Transcript_23741/g.49712  ORF Transcript_23741/g.49712 Transcript_23741/m.49712 type:complete len:134 (+) Transcript_23741:714-1115(+)